MLLLVQFSSALLGMLAVIFGAFGAHALKKRLGEEQIKNFETGVRYQFYHAIVLLMLGFNLGFTTPLENWICYAFLIGTLLFSFSIYALSLGARIGNKKNYLGLITPIGGLFLVIGWGLLVYYQLAFIF